MHEQALHTKLSKAGPSLSLVLELLNLINSVLKTMVLKRLWVLPGGIHKFSGLSLPAKGMGSCSLIRGKSHKPRGMTGPFLKALLQTLSPKSHWKTPKIWAIYWSKITADYNFILSQRDFFSVPFLFVAYHSQSNFFKDSQPATRHFLRLKTEILEVQILYILKPCPFFFQAF